MELKNRNLREKLSKTGPVEIFLTMVKVNDQRLTWQCDVTLGLTWQYVKQSRRVGRVGECGTGT